VPLSQCICAAQSMHLCRSVNASVPLSQYICAAQSMHLCRSVNASVPLSQYICAAQSLHLLPTSDFGHATGQPIVKTSYTVHCGACRCGFLWWRAPQQMLRTHRSLESLWSVFFSFFEVMEHRWNKIVRENRSTGEKPVPVPLCPPQIPHGLTRDRTRASAVGCRCACVCTYLP
jgi:hypothetical protein